MYRDPKYLERNILSKFYLTNHIVAPPNGQEQNKTKYEFVVDDRENWYDWSSAFFYVKFVLDKKADGTKIGAGDAPVNGSFSLIRNMIIESYGKKLYEAKNINKLIFVKNLLEFSDDYARSTAKSHFWYLDTESGNTDGLDNTKNLGFNARELLSRDLKEVEALIPLDRYSFFENLNDKLLPPMKITFKIDLNNDKSIIWGKSEEGRIVVKNFELRVPRLVFTGEGQKLVNETFLKPNTMKFLNENVIASNPFRNRNGRFQISPAITGLKHVFVFFQVSDRVDEMKENNYSFDTFELDGTAKLTSCQLIYGSDKKYPETEYSTDYKLEIYNDLIEYAYRKKDYNTGMQLQTTNFETIYPIIYFDLRGKTNNMTNDAKQLVFTYTLSGDTTKTFNIFAAYMNETEVIFKQLGKELVVS